MSVIRKIPEIEKIVNELTDAQRAKLLTEVNNTAPLANKSLINIDYYFSALEEGAYEIIGVLLQVAPTVTLPGISIRTSAGDYFIEFGDNQQLILYHLDIANKKIEKIDEELNINELRRVLTGKIVTENIAELSDDDLNNLKPGDVVIKLTPSDTGMMSHTYFVTYKEEKHGICLSYFAAGYSETISYDYTDGHWVYNSKDVGE